MVDDPFEPRPPEWTTPPGGQPSDDARIGNPGGLDSFVYYRDPATFHEDIEGPLLLPLPELDLQVHISQLRRLISEQIQSQKPSGDFAEPGVPVDLVEMHKVTNGINLAGIPSEASDYKLVESLPSTDSDTSNGLWSNDLQEAQSHFHYEGNNDRQQEIVAAFQLGSLTLQEIRTFYAYCRALPKSYDSGSSFLDRPGAKLSWRVLQAGIRSGGLHYLAIFPDLRDYIDAWRQKIVAISRGTNDLPHSLSEW